MYLADGFIAAPPANSFRGLDPEERKQAESEGIGRKKTGPKNAPSRNTDRLFFPDFESVAFATTNPPGPESGRFGGFPLHGQMGPSAHCHILLCDSGLAAPRIPA